jgi:hypothetical protein
VLFYLLNFLGGNLREVGERRGGFSIFHRGMDSKNDWEFTLFNAKQKHSGIVCEQ